MIILKSSCIAWPSRTDCMAGFVSADYFFFRCFCVSKYISSLENTFFYLLFDYNLIFYCVRSVASALVFFWRLDGLSRFPNVRYKKFDKKVTRYFPVKSSVNKSIQDNASQLIFWKSSIDSKFAFYSSSDFLFTFYDVIGIFQLVPGTTFIPH